MILTLRFKMNMTCSNKYPFFFFRQLEGRKRHKIFNASNIFFINIILVPSISMLYESEIGKNMSFQSGLKTKHSLKSSV